MGWESNVRKVVPYVPGEQPAGTGIIKLNTNENPYPPSPMVIKAMREFDAEKLRLYPDPEATELLKAIADCYHVPCENVFPGVGSDDVLAMAFLAFFNGDGEVLFPDISYSFYSVWVSLFEIPARQIPVGEDFTINPEDYYNAPGGVVIANPNAPTGLLLSAEAVESIVSHNPDCVVIVDEAYIDFGGTTVLPLIERYDNLLIIRTTSKSRAMAGSRIGYAFGSEKIIRYLKDVKYSINSYTMNSQTIAAGTAAFKDTAYFKDICGRIIRTRERLAKELQALGFVFPESSANFIFARHPSHSGQELFDALKERRIYVRHWNTPRIEDYLRITVGTEEETDRLLTALKEIL